MLCGPAESPIMCNVLLPVSIGSETDGFSSPRLGMVLVISSLVVASRSDYRDSLSSSAQMLVSSSMYGTYFEPL